MAAALRKHFLRNLFRSPQFAAQMRYGISASSHGLRTSAIRFGLDEDFTAAKKAVNELADDPGNDVKLQMYALFKQSTEGKNTKPKPGVLDFVGRAKWDAWSGLGDMSKDEAKKKYINIVSELKAAESTTPKESLTGDHNYEELIVNIYNGCFAITLNRPRKKNAINHKMYAEITQALDHAANDYGVRFLTITGAGDYYCSGNDLGNFAGVAPDRVKEMAENGGDILHRYVSAFIDFPKPIIGLVNGPAVGVSVTVMGMFDAVLASDRATFHTPFTVLGQAPEGCSTLTFPKIMGNVKAAEMLMFNRKITAHEAYERNLVTRVIPDESFLEETNKYVAEVAKLPPNCLKEAKRGLRDVDRDQLHKANSRECDILVQLWQSPECAKAIMDFFARKA